jgi:hypothetical protein
MNDVVHSLNTNYKLDRNVSCVKYKPQYVVVVGILLKVCYICPSLLRLTYKKEEDCTRNVINVLHVLNHFLSFTPNLTHIGIFISVRLYDEKPQFCNYKFSNKGMYMC